MNVAYIQNVRRLTVEQIQHGAADSRGIAAGAGLAQRNARSIPIGCAAQINLKLRRIISLHVHIKRRIASWL